MPQEKARSQTFLASLNSGSCGFRVLRFYPVVLLLLLVIFIVIVIVIVIAIEGIQQRGQVLLRNIN